MDKAKEEIISKLPAEIGEWLKKCSWENLQEIRFRAGRPAMLYYGDKTLILKKENFGIKDIEKLLGNFCRNSIYAYCDDIKEGFITISGGHRIGISGRAVYSNGNLLNITSYSGVNIRIAREYKNSAQACINYIEDGKKIFNTIIISPPGGGKTTLLRDIARRLGESKEILILWKNLKKDSL